MMKYTATLKMSLLWGVITGCCLGLTEAVISIWVWHAFDQPDFLYRGSELEIMAIGFTGGGAITGVYYGLILSAIAASRNVIIPLYKHFLILMGVGVAWYSFTYWATLKYQILLFLAADLVLFVFGLLLAVLFAKREKTQHRGPVDAAARRD
jgi:hypothetical protein